MHNSTKKARLFKHLNIYPVLRVIIVIQLAYKSKGPLNFRRKNCQRLNRYNFGTKKRTTLCSAKHFEYQQPSDENRAFL